MGEADGYYSEEAAGAEDIDLSFLDEKKSDENQV